MTTAYDDPFLTGLDDPPDRSKLAENDFRFMLYTGVKFEHLAHSVETGDPIPVASLAHRDPDTWRDEVRVTWPTDIEPEEVLGQIQSMYKSDKAYREEIEDMFKWHNKISVERKQ